jgi:hypothetical protein
MRDLADVHYPKAERIRVVLDNLSTHSAGALYKAFPATEARRLLRRLEFHYVPKHASWLNMVEIEIGVLASQCLDRRIESRMKLAAETAAWEQQRNAARARMKWMFTTDKARAKMGRAYPKPGAKSASKSKSQNLCAESKPLCSGTSFALGELSGLPAAWATAASQLRVMCPQPKSFLLCRCGWIWYLPARSRCGLGPSWLAEVRRGFSK